MTHLCRWYLISKIHALTKEIFKEMLTKTEAIITNLATISTGHSHPMKSNPIWESTSRYLPTSKLGLIKNSTVGLQRNKSVKLNDLRVTSKRTSWIPYFQINLTIPGEIAISTISLWLKLQNSRSDCHIFNRYAVLCRKVSVVICLKWADLIEHKFRHKKPKMESIIPTLRTITRLQ